MRQLLQPRRLCFKVTGIRSRSGNALAHDLWDRRFASAWGTYGEPGKPSMLRPGETKRDGLARKGRKRKQARSRLRPKRCKTSSAPTRRWHHRLAAKGSQFTQAARAMPSSGRQVRSRPELRSTRARIVRRTIGVLFPIAVQDNAQKARSLRAWGAFTILALWRGAKGER